MSVVKVLGSAGVVAVVRAPDAQSVIQVAEALIEGGVYVIEVTFTTPDAASAISNVASRFGGDVVVGAGTVTTPLQAKIAADSGAQFLVSPGFDVEVGEAMRDTGVTTIVGSLTPSEVMAAVSFGAEIIKIFPASLGGPSYLKSLRGPFPVARFMPTGGVRPDNLKDWLRAGAFAVGAGGDLVSERAIREKDWESITLVAKQFMRSLNEHRDQHAGGRSD